MVNWKNALAGPHTSLEKAIEVLDKGALRIVLVVDEDKLLLGTVTDGDLRRALLNHLPLTTKISEVMCAKPIVARIDWDKKHVLSVMEKKQLLQLPIVNDVGQLIGLDTLYSLLNQTRLGNPVFLMAGGFGTRLHPLTENCPKPLLKIGTKPILALILESFIKSGFHKFYISTHYLPEMIQDYFGDGSNWGVSITYIYEEAPLGTGGALGLLPHNEINLPMLMMNGDVLTTLDYRGLLDFHNEQTNIASMCVRKYEHQVPYGVVESSGSKITSMVEKPVLNYFINAGIYVLSPELVKSVKAQTKVDMPTLLEQKIKQGNDVTVFPLHEYWLDIGRPPDYERANIEFGKIFE